MANNYYDMTGTLKVKKVTPVIKTLFSEYNLDAEYPGNEEVYIAQWEGYEHYGSWTEIAEHLETLAFSLGLSVKEDYDSCLSAFEELIKHFRAEYNPTVATLLEEYNNLIRNGERARLSDLYNLALAFDDGHGLTSYQVEAAWYCSKPRLDEFGGEGEFYSQEVHTRSISSDAVTLGVILQESLQKKDYDSCARAMLAEFNSAMGSIRNEQARSVVAVKTAALFSQHLVNRYAGEANNAPSFQHKFAANAVNLFD